MKFKILQFCLTLCCFQLLKWNLKYYILEKLEFGLICTNHPKCSRNGILAQMELSLANSNFCQTTIKKMHQVILFGRDSLCVRSLILNPTLPKKQASTIFQQRQEGWLAFFSPSNKPKIWLGFWVSGYFLEENKPTSFARHIANLLVHNLYHFCFLYVSITSFLWGCLLRPGRRFSCCKKKASNVLNGARLFSCVTALLFWLQLMARIFLDTTEGAVVTLVSSH